jgi:hypothetical protein
MGSWITTKQLLLHQDAKSSHTRNQGSGELGLLTGSMDIHLVPPCTITGVKMYTSRQRPANVSWILLNYFQTIIKYHSYRPPTDCSCIIPHGFSSNFQTQITTSPVPRDSSFACQSRSTLKPHSLINSNFELAHAQQEAKEITDDNSHSRHPKTAITSEGGHPEDTTSITSQGVHWLPSTLAPQLVSR